MFDELYSTRFVNRQGQSLGSDPGLLPIPLRIGMQITIHGQTKPFIVVDWKFHKEHLDQGGGLEIILEQESHD